MPENGWAMVWRRSDQYCRLPGIKKRPKKRKDKKRPVQSNLSPSFFRFLVERYAVAQAGRRTLFIFRYNSVGGIVFRLCRSRTDEDRVSKKKTRENLKERQTQTDVSRQFIRAPNNLMQTTKTARYQTYKVLFCNV